VPHRPPATTRYFYTVSALDVLTLEVAADVTPAIVGLRLRPHVGRAQIIGMTETTAHAALA
jgi:phosphatidylethanolamine-binding protein (PEBP) family uncharacterized protein